MPTGWDELPAIQDKEVSEPEGDRFGHRDLEKALRGLVESELHEPPYSIGLLGRWGSGKSTVRAMYEHRLHNEADRSRGVRIVSFNAWRYGGGEVKRALLRHIFLKIGGEDSELQDELYRQVHRHSTEDRPNKEILADLKALWKAVAVQFILLFVAWLLLAPLLIYLLGIDTALARSLVVAATIGSLPFLGRYLLNPVPWRANVTRLDLPRTTAEQYEEFLKKRLVAFKKEAPDVERLVVFVDDLDRLPAEEMVDGLDAVRGFMDLPSEVSQAPGLVFVISCDEGKVAEALADRRRQRDSEMPATISSREDARRYLDRIFQFRLEVPPLPKRDMRGYAKRRLEEDLSVVATDLVEREVSLQDVIDRMIHPGVQSPRTAIHILNTFARSWWIARHRERTGGATRPGGLTEGAVTAHPETLAALAAVQVDFPEFYEDLKQHPDLLDAFSRVFVDGALLEEQPVGLEEVLTKYRQESENGDSNRSEVKSRYRRLRAFVSGLRGMRRPLNLRPLIELSQDQLARDLGPRGDEILAALVEADTRGVLESFGHRDDRPLSQDEVMRLRDVVEETEGETPIRRENGGVVLAEIADLLPPQSADQVLGPLARRLVTSPDLRSRVGVEKIAALMPRLRVEDKQDLAGLLVEDVLRTQDDVRLQTDRRDTPTLEEAMSMARTAASAVLSVRNETGLANIQDGQLLDWLEVRRVSVGGETYNLPFSEFEGWMRYHEEHLLPALGARYTDMVASAANTGEVSVESIDDTIRRSQEVFEELAGGGKESLSTLWEQLAAFVSAREPRIAAVGWEFAASRPSTAGTNELNGFVISLTKRIEQEPTYSDESNLEDIRGATTSLVRLSQDRAEDLSGEPLERIGDLAKSLGVEEDERLAGEAVGLVNVLRKADPEQSSEVTHQWADQVLTELNSSPRRWLARTFAELNPDERKAGVSGLAVVTNSNEVEDETAVKYAEFMRALGESGADTEELRGHLAAVLQRGTNLIIPSAQAQQQQRNNQQVIDQVRNYLAEVLPAAAPLMAHAPESNIASFLNRAFHEGLYIQRDHQLFGELHEAMIGNWPDAARADYKAEDIFNTADTAVKQNPALDEAPDILRSVSSLSDRQELGSSYSERVVDAACTVWPHDTETALKVMLSYEGSPAPERVASLAQPVNPNNVPKRAMLTEAWSHYAPRLSLEAQVEVLEELLTLSLAHDADYPDWPLQTWLDTVKDPGIVLSQALAESQVEDEELERLWLRADEMAGVLGMQFFHDTLVPLLAREDIERTASAVRASSQKIAALYEGQTARNSLGRILLEALVATPRETDKSSLAQWIKDADAAGSLEHLRKLDPSEVDQEILSEVFPDNPMLKKKS